MTMQDFCLWSLLESCSLLLGKSVLLKIQQLPKYFAHSCILPKCNNRTMGVMTPFFLVLNMLGMFRVDPLEEEVGLDISHHKGSAYNIVGADQTKVDELNEKRETKHGNSPAGEA
jgi:hypothetical protein